MGIGYGIIRGSDGVMIRGSVCSKGVMVGVIYVFNWFLLLRL